MYLTSGGGAHQYFFSLISTFKRYRAGFAVRSPPRAKEGKGKRLRLMLGSSIIANSCFQTAPPFKRSMCLLDCWTT